MARRSTDDDIHDFISSIRSEAAENWEALLLSCKMSIFEIYDTVPLEELYI
jgi:hypothetical protein